MASITGEGAIAGLRDYIKQPSNKFNRIIKSHKDFKAKYSLTKIRDEMKKQLQPQPAKPTKMLPIKKLFGPQIFLITK